MSSMTAAGAFKRGDRTVNRLGYRAIQLAGPGVFGPPKDRNAAIVVLLEVVAQGVNLANNMWDRRRQSAAPTKCECVTVLS